MAHPDQLTDVPAGAVRDVPQGGRPGGRAGSCRVLVAAAGYGKTTAIEARTPESGVAYLGTGGTADLSWLAARPLPVGTTTVVVDDLDRATNPVRADLGRLLAGLPRQVDVHLP